MIQKITAATFNLPYTTLALLLGALSLPRKLTVHKKGFALVLHVASFWWWPAKRRGTRAMAIGNVVLLSPQKQEGDLEHELVHVEQFTKLPLLFPLLYFWESLRYGYQNNAYEAEAYHRAGNKRINP